MGELQRMTQYKDKTAKGETGITAGLFTYPCLMAADILMYDADFVPVGVDQKQHVELARDLAERFNNRYGETFRIPQPLTPKVGAKIYSLQNPTKKMSKSEANPKGTIDLLDDPAQARNKIKSAVTDSLGVVNYDPQNQPGVSNLLMIHSSLSGESIDAIVARYQGKGYGELKKEVGDIVFDFLSDLQKRYREIVASGVIEESAAGRQRESIPDRRKKGAQGKEKARLSNLKITSKKQFLHPMGKNCFLSVRFLDQKDQKKRQNDDSQGDPVIAEHFEIVFLDVGHQETDDQQGNDERTEHADKQQPQLHPAESETKLHQFQQTGPKHDRNGQKERKLRGDRTADTDHQRTDDRCAGTGGSRENGGDQLEDADDQRIPIGDL